MTDEVLVTLHDRYELHVGLDRRSGDSISSTFPEDVNSRQSSDTYRRILSIANEQSGVVTESVARHEPLSKRHYFDGGIDTNFIANALLTFTAGGSAVAFLKLAQSLLLQWLKNRASREVSITQGDTTISIKGSATFEDVIIGLDKLRAARPSPQTALPPTQEPGSLPVAHPRKRTRRKKRR